MRTVPEGIRDRHHILYPHRIWRTQSDPIRNLRGALSFKINQRLHKQLHTEIDAILGEDVDESYLPKESTLDYIAATYASNEANLNNLKPIPKIDWLLANLSEKDSQNDWLRMMLNSQREFLKSHTEGS